MQFEHAGADWDQKLALDSLAQSGSPHLAHDSPHRNVLAHEWLDQFLTPLSSMKI